MKTTVKILTLLFVGLSLAACEKPDSPTLPGAGTDYERDIFYTVAGEPGMASFTSNTVHIATEAQWDALLDDFCDLAQNGEQVTFASSARHNTPAAAKSRKDLPSTISTSDRAELKTWMKEMEKLGKTVNVTYDSESGTWNGRAYANLNPQETQAAVRDYSGTITFVATPVLDNPPLGGMVMALQVDGDATYIVTIHGMLLWFETGTTEDIMELLQGVETSFSGIAVTHTDLEGNQFRSLDLDMPEDGILEF